MNKEPNEIHENLILAKLTTIPYNITFYTTINIPYIWPAFLSAL